MKVKKAKQKNNFLMTESARKKIIITLILILIIRVGSHLSIPGITQKAIIESRSFNLKPLNIYSNSLPNLFSIGIGPSITASILMQIILSINTELKKIQREEGEYGRRIINRYIRVLTLIITIFQSIFLTLRFRPFLNDFNFYRFFEISSLLVTGSMILLWISEKITKNGIVKGSSLLVFLNVAENLPYLFYASLNDLTLLKTILLIVTLTITMTSIIFLQQTTRQILLKKSNISTLKTEKNTYKQKAFFPCKLNTSGVMPLVFVSYFLPILSNIIFSILIKINNFFNIQIVFPSILTKFIYYFTEFCLICFFSQNYSIILIDPKDISEEFKKAAIYIPEIRPGQPTLEYLEKLFQRHAFIGGVILAFNTILMNIVGSIIKLPIVEALSISSQIIMIGIIVEGYEKIYGIIITDIYKKYL